MAERRLAAEWEPQAGVLLAWPDEQTDWAPRLDAIRREFAGIAAAITRFEPVLLVVRDEATLNAARVDLAGSGVDLSRVLFALAPFDDTWIRDYGPLSLRGDGGASLIDFRFDGWGGKFDARRDDAVSGVLHRGGCFNQTPMASVDLVLEGGAIETDGAGTLLTTTHCWRARHPARKRADVETLLADHLGVRRVLWLDRGHLAGDDTDAHVDTLARFCAADCIAYQACDDRGDEHFDGLAAMAGELGALRTTAGKPYRLLPLPWPGAIHDGKRRLPASYANFLVVNGAVLVPLFDVPADREALSALAAAFPGRQVVGVPGRTLIWQNGGLHCATMQIAAGIELRGSG